MAFPHDYRLATYDERPHPWDNLPGPPAWYSDALCAQVGGDEMWFPEVGGSTRQAKWTCIACPVRPQCLDYAVANDERWGVWGGLSERERRQVKRGVTVAVTKPCPGCGRDIPARTQAQNCSDQCRERTRRRRGRAA